jgi:hypothetical protein
MLLQACLGHENAQVNCVARYIHERLEQAPAAMGVDAPKRNHNDEPPSPPSSTDRIASQSFIPADSGDDTRVMQQTAIVPETTLAHDGTYTYQYLYKKERTTYRAHAREDQASYPQSMASSISSEHSNINATSDLALVPLPLPPCLSNAKADQKRDVWTALKRLSPQQRQDVLDELQARSQGGGIRNIVAYFFGLIRRIFSGEFRLWAGRKPEQQAVTPQAAAPAPRPANTQTATRPVPRTAIHPAPAHKTASPEVARAALDNMRKMLNGPRAHRRCRRAGHSVQGVANKARLTGFANDGRRFARSGVDASGSIPPTSKDRSVELNPGFSSK